MISFGLGLVASLIINLMHYYTQSFLISNSSGRITSLNFNLFSIAYNFTSLLGLLGEIIIIYLLVSKLNLIINKKEIIKDSIFNYISIAIGSLLGSIFEILIISNGSLRTLLSIFNLPSFEFFPIVIGSLSFAFSITIMFVSIILLYWMYYYKQPKPIQ